MKQFKNHIIVGVVALIVGFILAWSIKPKTKTEFLAGKTVTEYKDTCVESKLLCTLTTKDSLAIYRYIREGFKSKSEKVVAQVEEVKEPTEVQKQQPLKERKYTKILNNGVVTVWDTLTVLGTIENWDRAYKVNEVVEVQEKSTTTTAVIAEGKDDSNTETTKYLPVDNSIVDGKSKQGTWFNLGGSATMNPKNQLGFDVGGGIRFNHTQINLFKDPTTQFKSLERWRVQMNQEVFRLSRK